MTITGAKRLISASKWLVTTSQKMQERGFNGSECQAMGALAIGATAVTYYYCRDWFQPANNDLKNILNGDQTDPMIEDTLEVQTPEIEAIDVKPKRRVRHGSKNNFMREVISCAKNRFGTPSNTAANHRIVRRFMLDFMKEHDVRNATIREVMPRLVTAMFVPDKYEIEAAKMANCPLAHARKLEYAALQRISGITAC